MPTQEQIKNWPGHDLVGPDHEKLGQIEHVYLDRQSGEPTFAAVKTGLFAHQSLVPIENAVVHQAHGHVAVDYTRDQVKNAPHLGNHDELSPDDEAQLRDYYGQAAPAAQPDQVAATPEPDQAAATGGPTAPDGTPTALAPVADPPAATPEVLPATPQHREAGPTDPEEVTGAPGERLRTHVVTDYVPVAQEVRIEQAPDDAPPEAGDPAARDAGDVA